MRSRHGSLRTLACVVTLVGCSCAAGPSPEQSTTGAAAASASTSSTAAPDDTTAAAPVVEGPSIEVDRAVKKWLDDPRLADAKKSLMAGKTLAAARAATEARVLAKEAPAEERAALAYLEGSLNARAGVPEVALEAFRIASSIEGPLVPHALFRMTELAASLGKHELAVASAAKIEAGRVPRARIDTAVVESAARAGTVEEARAIATRLFLGTAAPRQPGWALLALRVARTLSKRPTVEHARLALEIADRVRFDSMRGRGSDDAEKLAKELASRLPSEESKSWTAPSDDVLIERGRRLAEADQGKRALAILDKVAKRSASLAPKTACALLVARGKALGGVKRKREAFDELDAATKRCEGDALADALMAAGRAAARSNLHEEAASLFGRFEAGFPKHALADDARLEAAREMLEAGDGVRFRKLLSTIADDYPEGDKVGDALFALAIDAMERGAWAEAKSVLEKGAARPVERVYTRSGRFEYFLGRALIESGDRAKGEASLEAALVNAPLSYYAALAASRLDRDEPGRAKRVLAAAEARKDPVVARVAAARAKEPPIAAALVLAGVEDPRGVEDALAAVGLKDHTGEAGLYLFGAQLVAMAGDRQAAHALLRTARERDFDKGKLDCDVLVTELPRGAAREAWELSFPKLFEAEVDAAAAESGVPRALLWAVMREESSFLPRALSVSDARGLLQIIPPTASRVARSLGLKYKADLLYEPAANVRIGAKYLTGLRARFGDAKALAVAGYNAGPGAPEAWIDERPSWDLDLWVERIPFSETKNYVKRVWSSYFVYQVLYGDGALGEITQSSTKVPGKARSG